MCLLLCTILTNWLFLQYTKLFFLFCMCAAYNYVQHSYTFFCLFNTFLKKNVNNGICLDNSLHVLPKNTNSGFCTCAADCTAMSTSSFPFRYLVWLLSTSCSFPITKKGASVGGLYSSSVNLSLAMCAVLKKKALRWISEFLFSMF